MTDKSGTGIPWAGVAVAVAIVSSVVVHQQPFEPLRPPEKERVQGSSSSRFEVDARLWEDPFAAWRRQEAEQAAERMKWCGAGKAGTTKCQEPEKEAVRRTPEYLRAQLQRSKADHDLADTLMIAVLVPGHPFVGAEEYRRRTRYAVLAGLQAMEYVPLDAEHIGVLALSLPLSNAGEETKEDAQENSGCPKPQKSESDDPILVAPYEVLSARQPPFEREALRDEPRHRRIGLVWVNEEALPGPSGLNSLARLLTRLLCDPSVTSHSVPPQLAVIGPSSSETLRGALGNLEDAVAKIDGLPDEVRWGYRQLAQATLLNAASTVPASRLEVIQRAVADPARPHATLESFVLDRLSRFLKGSNATAGTFQSTIATDDLVLARLAQELRLRLPQHAKRRVVLIAERDSIYAQALVGELAAQISGDPDLAFEVEYFFRGIDGVTTREGNDPSPASRPATDTAAKSAMAIEWPESRDQRDYLRRLATTLQSSEAMPSRGPIGAIGIIATDVHDKLLVLQALHASFPDKVFFTTDMDARFLHPRTNTFVRNLVVVSSLPLEFRSPSLPATFLNRTLQAGTPPLRDVYQSATYLAARRAACRSLDCKARETSAVKEVLDQPSVYEIGRHREVPLAGYDHAARHDAGRGSATVVAASLGILLAGALLVWPSTPALRSARANWLGHAALSPSSVPLDAPAAWLTALHAVLLAFVAGSLFEFAHPGSTGVVPMTSLAALCGLFVGLALHPWRSTGQPAAYGADSARPRRRTHRDGRVFAIVAIVFCAVVAALAWSRSPGVTVAGCTECEPVAWLEGVSAWPSHLIHLAALAGVAWALDDFWSNAVRSMQADAEWLGLSSAVSRTQRRTVAAGRLGLSLGLIVNALTPWRSSQSRTEHFLSVWCGYLWRGRASARAVRIAFWYLTTLAMAVLLFWVFSDGYVVEVPVRGPAHRQLVGWTLYAVLLALPLLVVTVADATVLECRLIGRLCQGRISFPPPTISRFGQTLGAQFEPVLTARRAANPLDRGDLGNADTPHTLLDDWITVQLVARRTSVVAPLVIGPFIVLALIVVARSRLFDNWALTLPVALAATAYLLWLVTLAALLKLSAERLRRQALERMNADLQWLSGTEQPALVEPFKRLVVAVETNMTGAFAPFFEQPLFKALLVPLGGAGGARLFDQLLLAQ